MRPRLILARITSEAGDQHWRTQMTVGRHQILGDEPETLGGGDVGPAPFAYLLAGLVSCTSVTVRMYAEKHAIPLQRIEVNAKALRNEEDGINSIERQVRLIGDLNESDRREARKCRGKDAGDAGNQGGAGDDIHLRMTRRWPRG